MKLKEKGNELYKKFRAKVLARWTKIPELTRKSFLINLSSALNYLINSCLLSVPFTFFISSWSWSWKMYFILVLCGWILMPFIEHYYVWFRENWKDSIRKDDIENER